MPTPKKPDSSLVNNGWIDVKENLPPLDEENFSDDIYLRNGKTKVKGYYDGFMKVWWALPKDDNYSIAETFSPTHWRMIKNKKQPNDTSIK